MKEALEIMLNRHDNETTDYLENNKRVIFGAITKGEDFPKGIVDYLAFTKAQRDIIVTAMEKLDAIDPIK